MGYRLGTVAGDGNRIAPCIFPTGNEHQTRLWAEMTTKAFEKHGGREAPTSIEKELLPDPAIARRKIHAGRTGVEYRRSIEWTMGQEASQEGSIVEVIG